MKVRGIRNIQILPSGADVKVFMPSQDVEGLSEKFGFTSQNIQIVLGGYIGGRFGLDLIINSLYEVLRYYPNLKLLITGTGSGINELIKKSTDLIIKDHVVYLGDTVSSDQVAQILSMYDIDIVPSDSNPQWVKAIPVKFLENAACGLSVFVTVPSRSELSSLIRDNQRGTLADPENIQDGINGLFSLISRKDYVVTARIAGVNLAQTTFDRNLMAQKLKQVIISDAPNSNI